MTTPTPRPQAFITGGSRGIGRAICLELAAQGYDIAFTYRTNFALARQLEQDLSRYGARAKGYETDAADAVRLAGTLEEMLRDFPQVETLVNNAGISTDGLTLRFKIEDFDRIINTNVRSAFLATQAVTRSMLKAKRGNIIFMSSVIGQCGNAGQVAYSASKAALIGLTKSLAKELASRRIRVNAVAPGFIQTDMTSTLPAENKESIVSQIPLGEIGMPEDIAKAVAFLSSPAARYITGQVLAVNGGLYM